MTGILNILIPDGDSTWALTVLHCLSRVEGYNIVVLSNKKRTATRFSRYTSYYKFYEKQNDTSWLNVINSEVKLHSIDVIVPISEKEISFFIKHKTKIEDSATIIPLPEFSSFEIAINKKKLNDFAKANDVPHPNSFFITSEVDIQQLWSKIQFPILIKPLSLKGGDGIQKISTKEKFEDYFEKINHPILIQEYIEGYDIDCSVLCLNGTVLNHTIQKGNLKGNNVFAPQLAFDFLKNDDVLKVAKQTMSKLNWSGVAHLDMRYDLNANDFKLIEINARFWGSLEGSKCAGVNFPHQVIELALGKKIIKTGFEPIHYMRLKGVWKSIKRNPLFIFKRTYLLNNTEVKMFLNDPLPTFYKFREWVGRRF
ncbi:MAG: glutathione synthase/RimK-type ligase-like ATP-grasp enzyme [Glaciecola sp.]|jgi:glutathione synthase/RimK-type ligase-like ATP-grasp enzyme